MAAYDLYFFNRVVNQIDTTVINKRYIKSFQAILDDKSKPININPEHILVDDCIMKVVSKKSDQRKEEDSEFLSYKISSFKAYIDVKLLSMDVTDAYADMLSEMGIN